MFGNRQRKPRDVKANPTFLAPKQEANTTYSSPGPAISSRLNVEIEDPQTVVPPQVTEIMSIIKLNWDFMTSTEFSAIPYSLSLSDPSSVGSDYQRFLDTFAMVDEAMDLVVNDYYDVFNTSIGRFSQVIDVIRDSQKKETELEGMLKMSKEELECQKYDFLHLWVKHLQYKEMAKILDLVAEVQGLVDSLEPLVIDKEYVQVVLKIRAAEKMLQNNVLSEIGALSILKEKIEKIKQYLRENLTEELIRIVYLTDDYTRMQEKIDAPDVSQLIFDKSAGLENLGFNKEMEIVEPYYHMQEIIEVLYHLGELDNSLQTVKDRITVDTYNVVSQVIQEVEEEFPSCSDKNVYIDDGDDSPQDHVIIHRLLYLLYERMFAVVEGHLFILKCLEAIHTEFNVEKPMIYSKREVAAVIQNEVKALLYDYLSGGAVDNSQNGTSIVALTEMLKDTSKEKLKLSKQLFYIKQQPDDVYTRELKLQCGYQIDIALAAESPSSEGMQLDHIMLDSFVTAIQSGHKMLVPPAVSHILVCFEPTVLFMRQLEQKIGMNLVNFNVFLTDFIMNIYLPNIQEQILVYHHSNIHGIDAFQAEKCPAADYPLIKSALCMVLATHGICRLTKMMPIHSEELIRVLIQLLGKYYQYCVRRLNNLLLVDAGAMDDDAAVDDPEILSLKWAKSPQISELLAQNTFLTSDTPDIVANSKLNDLETAAELKLLGDRSIHRLDLLPESRRLLNLGHLTYGLDWMLTQLNFLVSKREVGGQQQNYLASKSNGVLKAFASLSDDSLYDSADVDFQKTDLVVPIDLQQEYDDVIAKFKDLTNLTLYSMRIEIRCRLIYYLDLALREGNYAPDEEQTDPDPYINILNTDLTEMEELICESLPPRKANFVFDNITKLIDKILLNGVRMLKQVNKNGVLKLVSNVESLQQNLIGFVLVQDNQLSKTKKYFKLMTMSGSEILNFMSINKGLFGFDDYKMVMELRLEEPERSNTIQFMKDYFIQNKA